MIPIDDSPLRVQSAQLNKTISITTEQQNPVPDDEFIRGLIDQLVICLGWDKFRPVNPEGELLDMLSEFKFLDKDCFKWGCYFLIFDYDIFDQKGYVEIKKRQGGLASSISHKLEFIVPNIQDLQEKLITILVQKLCEGMRVWAESVKTGASEVVKNNVDTAFARMLLCCKEHQNTLDLSGLELGSLPPLPEWIKELSVRGNELSTIQMPLLCQNLDASRNKLTEFPKVSAISQIYLNNNMISHIDSFPPYASIIDICYNNLSEIPAIPDNTKEFYCSHNKITTLPNFPNNMKRVNVGYNNIQTIPVIGTKLKTLCIAGTPFEKEFIKSRTLKLCDQRKKYEYCLLEVLIEDDSIIWNGYEEDHHR
ncbi:DUF5503 domain-containing protein [Escherichia coli]|uniref:DUF5503 domain-containing protein n=1 Tax=Escherichia coli TaxID=562 RepID=UPI0013665FEB|nr:DUF5503 domain-containing protein [Escherichia coli]MWT71391.1 leucine-rich repeat domain-containing protein [Escherichia coli]